MSLSEARKSLEIYVRDFAKKHGLGVSYENVKAIHEGEYLECFILPISPYDQTFSSENHQYIFQVNFYLNENESAKKTDALIDGFSHGLSSRRINNTSAIYKPISRSPSIRSGGKYMTAISIYFQFSKTIY
ncbi:MAG: hypothetical protein ACRCXK_05605 [Wohlfahrtiimonas sp.]